MKKQLLFFFTILFFAFSFSYASSNSSATIIKGEAKVKVENLFSCKNSYSRPSPLGIKALDDKNFTVPSIVKYKKENFASDLYNICLGITPNSLNEVDIQNVPIIEINKDGEVITAYIFADNYFELYINGKLVGVDSVPFTPFNSSIVRFKVNKPYDIAVKVVDWEENAGLGSEASRGNKYHAGDGGFIASFSDGTISNNNWFAQTFYTAPIYDLNCVKEEKSLRISKDCNPNKLDKNKNTYSMHWDIPTNWETSKDYLAWPKATTFTEDEIGVDNKSSYMNFQKQFSGSGASFIWSNNVVLDNLVLLRYQVK